jgi:transcriptional regulator with XRE-family HTH domain
MNLEEYRRQLLGDPEVAAAQRRLQPKLDLAGQVLHLRLENGWTQKELAERAGTKQANISRLENAKLNPSVEMLQRVADALGAELEVSSELEVSFVPSDKAHPAPAEQAQVVPALG